VADGGSAGRRWSVTNIFIISIIITITIIGTTTTATATLSTIIIM
jgi:hypothetical protein